MPRTGRLIGCVAAEGPPLDYGFRWHDSEIPIGKDLIAVEKAILECAYLGVDSIWVTCPARLAIILRHRIGDAVIDPMIFTVRCVIDRKMYNDHARRIPIFYIPMNYTDRGKRDSHAWAALNSGYIASRTMKDYHRRGNIDKYYLAFPYGAFPFTFLMKLRGKIWSKDRMFLSYEGQTIKDGPWLGAVIQHDDLIDMRKWVKQNEVALANEDRNLRYSSQKYGLSDIFKNLKVGDDYDAPLKWYYDISNWDGLMTFFKEQSGYKKSFSKLFRRNTIVKL